MSLVLFSMKVASENLEYSAVWITFMVLLERYMEKKVIVNIYDLFILTSYE